MMQHVCCFADMLDILGFLIHNVERYSCYFILFELLFDFLSNDEFKFVRIVGRMINPYMMMGLQHGVMPPLRGGMGGPSGRGATFFGAGVRDLRDHLCCTSLTQFNAS